MGNSRELRSVSPTIESAAEPTIVEMGEVRTVFVTGILPLEHAKEFTRLTCLEDHPWGGRHGPERQVVVRLALTPSAIADLLRLCADLTVSKRGGH
jgi:hypothetical protein